MRTTLVGSWPPSPRFVPDLGRYHSGLLDPACSELLLGEVAAIAMAEQRTCGVDQITGGETSSDNFILHFPRMLSGIVPSENVTAWDGRGMFEIVGTLGAPHGLGIAEAFARERRIDPRLEKVKTPGPSEITIMLEPREAARQARSAVVDLIRNEIRAVVDIGAREVQLDLPHVAMGLADGEWEIGQAVALVSEIFERLSGVRRSLHLCYGDFMARTWARNRQLRPLIPMLQRLSNVVDRVVIELSLAEQWADRELLSDLDRTNG
jgi:methionine synthase II (cobalamin-independent)